MKIRSSIPRNSLENSCLHIFLVFILVFLLFPNNALAQAPEEKSSPDKSEPATVIASRSQLAIDTGDSNVNEISTSSSIGITPDNCTSRQYAYSGVSVETKSTSNWEIDYPGSGAKISIGNGTSKFSSKTLFSAFDGESQFSLDLFGTGPISDTSVVGSGEDTSIIAQNADYRITYKPVTPKEGFNDLGGFDYSVEFIHEPLNIPGYLSFTLGDKDGIIPYFQPSLKEQYKDGWSDKFRDIITVTDTDVYNSKGESVGHRPDYVVNSIAFYTDDKKGDYTALGGKNYKAGKVGHLYRLKAIDEKGKSAWMDWQLYSDAEIRLVDSTGFLKTATYPVVIAPVGDTFGITSLGMSEDSHWDYVNLFVYYGVALSAGTGSSLSFCMANVATGTDYNVKAALFHGGIQVSPILITNGYAGSQLIARNTAKGWKTFNFITSPNITAYGEYDFGLAMEGDGEAWQELRLYYDDMAQADQGLLQSGTYTYSQFPSASSYNYEYWAVNDIYSAYCTFAIPPSAPTNVSASDGTCTDKVQITWTASSGASGYKVYRNVADYSYGATQIGTCSSSPYNDSSAAMGDIYYYWVKAYNDGGVSIFSNVNSGWRSSSVSLSSAVDNPTLTFTYGGNSNWFGQINTFYYDGDAAQSAYCPSDESTWMQTTVSGSGLVKFYWKTSFYDNEYCYFKIDEATKESVLGGNLDWQQNIVAVDGTGNHTLKWQVTIYGQSDGGCCWIDKVEWIPVPASPTNVNATDGTNTDKVQITWTASSGATGYKVYRSTSSDNSTAGNPIGTPTTESFNDTNAATETNYYYWVKASISGVDSGFSDPDTGWRNTTPPPPPSIPNAPTNVSASQGTDTDKVQITWMASSGVTSYKVYRNIFNNSNGAGTPVCSTTLTTFDDMTATAGTHYYYWVKATNVAGDSNFSSPPDIGWRAVAVPDSPTEVAATDGYYTNEIQITWLASSSATIYKVYRNTSNDISGVGFPIGVPTTASFVDTNGLAGTLYYYWVKACNDSGDSGFSRPDTGWIQTSTNLAEALDYTASGLTTGGNANWFGQSVIYFNGGDAAQSAPIGDYPQITWMQTTVNGAGTIKFYWKVSSEEDYDYLTFYIDEDEQNQISGLVGWNQQSFSISTGGPHTLKWIYSKDVNYYSGSDCGWVDKVEWLPPLAEALDYSTSSMTTGGNANWFGETEIYYNGGDAAQSGLIPNDRQTWMQTTVNGPGTIKFICKVSSEAGYDYLTFYIDEEMHYQGSGAGEWNQYNFNISEAGAHILKWIYSKDVSVSSGSDCGWVDKIEWLPIPAAAPTNVIATDGDFTDRIRITWAESTGASNYKVYRNTTNISGSSILVNSTTATYLDDTSALELTNYYYWVKACNSAGDSAFSVNDAGWQASVSSTWSYAIITDLHIGDSADNNDYGATGWNDGASGQDNNGQGVIYPCINNLEYAIQEINDNIDAENIKFVVVLGDLTDSAEMSEMNKVKEKLNALQIPWIPLIGNHDIWPYVNYSNQAPESDGNNLGTDKYFYQAFGTQYEMLCHELPNWETSPIPVLNNETQHYSYFENFAFDYLGFHFISLDFNAREPAPLNNPGVPGSGNLYNFENGTWNWFTNHLSNYVISHPSIHEDNIVLFAHHAMTGIEPYIMDPWMGFTTLELSIMRAYLVEYKNNLRAQFGGHYHVNWSPWEINYLFQNIMTYIETDDLKESPVIRLVRNSSDGSIDYSSFLTTGLMEIQALGPVDLVVTDPDGLNITRDNNEIPDATYLKTDIDGDGIVDNLIYINQRKMGDYSVKVVPTKESKTDETYSLEIKAIEDDFGLTNIYSSKEIKISDINKTRQSFVSKKRQSSHIVYSGEFEGKNIDSSVLQAILVDDSGRPLSGREIVFQLGMQTLIEVTDIKGIVIVPSTVKQKAGKYYRLTASFSGDEDYLPVNNHNSFEAKE